MARNGGKMAKRKICILFKFPDFNLLHLLFRYPFDIIGETAKFIWHPPIEFGHLLKFEKNDQYGGSKSVFLSTMEITPSPTVKNLN